MAHDKQRNREPRRHSVSISLSDKELAAIEEYCALFCKKSRAAVIREGAIRFVREKIIDRQTHLFPDLYDGMTSVAEPTTSAITPTATCRGRGVDMTPSLFEDLDFDSDDDDDDDPTE